MGIFFACNDVLRDIAPDVRVIDVQSMNYLNFRTLPRSRLSAIVSYNCNLIKSSNCSFTKILRNAYVRTSWLAFSSAKESIEKEPRLAGMHINEELRRSKFRRVITALPIIVLFWKNILYACTAAQVCARTHTRTDEYINLWVRKFFWKVSITRHIFYPFVS